MQNITVSDRQHLLDVAIQEAGTAEAAMALALQNGIGLTDQLSAGDQLQQAKPVNKEIVQLLSTENHQPATDGVVVQEGIDFFRIGVDFTIQ